MSGSTAAIASTMANRVAMWRILISVVGHALESGGTPEPERVQNVPARFLVDVKTRADGPRPLAPGEENRRRIIDHRRLKCGNSDSVLCLIGAVPERVQRLVDARV